MIDRLSGVRAVGGAARHAMLLAMLICVGCASMPARGPDRTAGLSLTMMVETADHARSYYRVERDGTLGFAGGREAERRAPSWRGELRDEEIATLQNLLDDDGWFAPRFPDRAQVEPGSADAIEYDVEVESPRGRVNFRLRSRHPAVTAVHELLDEAALRRFDPILESLPKAGEQRRR